MLTVDPSSVGQGTWVRFIDGTVGLNSLYWGFLYNSTLANGDNFSIKLPVPAAGTYKLRVNAVKYTNKAKMKVEVIQSGTTDLGTTDLYAALNLLNIVEITGISLVAGIATFRFTANGKNPSSTSYHLSFNGISLERTA
jgi:hypothetical protein